MPLTQENISKKAGRETHLYNISLEFGAGFRNVPLGPALAGKTSLLRVLAGLNQRFINYLSLTVSKNFVSHLKIASIRKAEIGRRGRATAEMFHIADLFDLQWAGVITTISI